MQIWSNLSSSTGFLTIMAESSESQEEECPSLSYRGSIPQLFRTWALLRSSINISCFMNLWNSLKQSITHTHQSRSIPHHISASLELIYRIQRAQIPFKSYPLVEFNRPVYKMREGAPMLWYMGNPSIPGLLSSPKVLPYISCNPMKLHSKCTLKPITILVYQVHNLCIPTHFQSEKTVRHGKNQNRWG